MTILFITRKFPPSTGGMESFSYELYMALKEKVDVKLIKWGGSNKYLPIILPWFLVQACWLLATRKVDVVHVNDGVLAPLGFVLSKAFHKPFTLVIHGLDITFKNKIFQTINVKCVSRAAIIFSVSRATADEAVKRGVNKARIRVIPNGVNDKLRGSKEDAHQGLRKELQLSADTLILLTVGRLVERKGVAWFMENVMPRLAQTYPKLVYVVVGEGENREKIERTIDSKKLTKHVKMLGRVDDEQMPTLYNGADVFVQPNIIIPGTMEGFGRVLLEASLCELPVVATGIEGIRDAISDGQNGVLVARPKDVSAFVKAISQFIDDKKAATAFGRKSRLYTLKHYQWATLSDQYVAGYREVVNK